MPRTKQAPAGNKETLVQPAILFCPCLEAKREAHVLVFPTCFSVGFGSCFEHVGLLNQTGVMHEYSLVIIGLERCMDIRAPKAVLVHKHPVTAGSGKRRADARTFEFGLADDP